MKNNNLAKKLALISAATVVSLAAQSVLAHTGIRNVVDEGVVSFNALNLSHGCNGNGDSATDKTENIIAMSALFPNAADPAMSVVTKLDPTTGASMGTLADLSADIVGVVEGKGFTGLGLNTVQPNVFPNFIPKIDANTLIGAHSTPLKRGFAAHNGPRPFASAPLWMEVTSGSAYAPFNVGPISFKSTSCAKSLRVRVAEVNWCLRGKVNDTKAARADVWIGAMTDKFNDPSVMPYSQADMDKGLAYWPTMTVNRNLTTNPLPADCGAGFNIAIQPSAADIDANLAMPKGPAPAGALQHYWPGQ